MSTKIKVYVVQRVLEDGSISADIVACKLRHIDAHQIAREFAPARVTPLVADKSPIANGAVNCTTPDAAEEAANGTRGYFQD